MCSTPPKAKKTPPPAPIAAPEIELGADADGSEDLRIRKRRGRNQLRTPGATASAVGPGLTIR